MIYHIVKTSEIPLLNQEEFRQVVINETIGGKFISGFFASPGYNNDLYLYVVLSDLKMKQISVYTTKAGSEFLSISPVCYQAHRFEREIYEQWKIVPQGHPWLKPVRCENSSNKIGDVDFYKVEGEEVHEVAVGPVHAGIIEPGHFRFECFGEEVIHLEIVLGYQHRGIEKHLVGGPNKRTISNIETIAGDTTIGHTCAYAQVIEALSNVHLPKRAALLRAIMLELERLANHAGDLGAMAGDVGFLPSASFLGRIRGDFLNLTALICGNRFGRGMIIPGGVNFDIDEKIKQEFISKLDAAYKDATGAIDVLFNSGSAMARFDKTGKISPQTVLELGIVGLPARASAVNRDVRYNFSNKLNIYDGYESITHDSGDVYSRAYVRAKEIKTSYELIKKWVCNLPEGDLCVKTDPIAPDQMVVSLVEGWRGEICHIGITNSSSSFYSYKIIDPSFHNWKALELSMRNGQISDFPLCNKSFNLSYCGHDL